MTVPTNPFPLAVLVVLQQAWLAQGHEINSRFTGRKSQERRVFKTSLIKALYFVAAGACSDYSRPSGASVRLKREMLQQWTALCLRGKLDFSWTVQ